MQRKQWTVGQEEYDSNEEKFQHFTKITKFQKSAKRKLSWKFHSKEVNQGYKEQQ